MIEGTKAGVGKTVSTYNLATCFGIRDTAALPVTIGHLIMARMDDEELPDSSSYIQNRNEVDLIPLLMVLSAIDVKLKLEMSAERMLTKRLEQLRMGNP